MIQLNDKQTTGAGWQNHGNGEMAPGNLPCPKRRSAFSKLPEVQQLGQALCVFCHPLWLFFSYAVYVLPSAQHILKGAEGFVSSQAVNEHRPGQLRLS